jgi:signal recognition particle receptor subunit beta
VVVLFLLFVKELSGLLKEEELKNAVLLVYANKSDLPNARSVAEVASRLKLNELRGRKWHVQSSSAVSGDGLFEGLGWAANALKTQKTGMTF